MGMPSQTTEFSEEKPKDDTVAVKAQLDMSIVLKQQGMLLLRMWLVAAKRSGISKEESRLIAHEASSKDFFHLVEVLNAHSEIPGKIGKSEK